MENGVSIDNVDGFSILFLRAVEYPIANINTE